MDLLVRQRINNIATRWVHGRRLLSRLDAPMASITFDDFPKSAWILGGEILARRGVKATYYTSGGFCGARLDGLDYFDADDLKAVHAAGHEVGCHTFDHRYGSRVRFDTLAGDVQRNRTFVEGVLGDTPLTSFAYPYGDASPRTKLLFARLFPSNRGIRAGVNAGVIDLAQLRSVALESRRWSAERIEGFVEEAVKRNGWLTFYTHDVSDDPTPFGCTPAMLEHALDALHAARVPVLTMREALDRALAESVGA